LIFDGGIVLSKQTVGIGMVFGAGFGIIIGVLFSLNLGLSIVMGSGVGIIVGIVIANFKG
jgi:hypothetical protein